MGKRIKDVHKYQLLINLPFARKGSIWRVINENSYKMIYPDYRHGDIVYKKGTNPKLFIGNKRGIVKPIEQRAGYVSREGNPCWDTLEGLFFERYKGDRNIFKKIE